MKIRNPLSKTTLALLLSTAFILPATEAAPRDVSASTSVELRLDYLDKLLQSRSGQRIKEFQPAVASETEQLLADARTAIAAGEKPRADQLAKQGLTTLMKATQSLPQDQEELNRHKKRYENLRQGLNKFTYAESDNKERFSISDTEPGSQAYDKNEITRLVQNADAAAANGEYQKAVLQLQEAQALVTASLHNILNHKKLVIELDIGTPEKEYFYELRRYMGYEELIPVALDVKKPEPPVAEEMLRLGDRAKWMSEQAREKAIATDYPVAIRMIMDATDVVRQALRLAGVTM